MLSESVFCLLTEDLLIRILDRVDSDRKSLRLVCKEFHRVESTTRKTIRILRIEFLLCLIQKYCNIESLDLSVCPRIDDGAVSILLSHGSVNWTMGIKRLILSRVTGLGYVGLEMLIRACPLLEAVDVSHCWGYGDREASALSCAVRLKELNMDKCLGVTDIGLAKIAVGCSKLERLSLKWCLEISDLGIDLLSKKCLELKFLDVSYLKVTSESLRSIASLLKLEVFIMVGCYLVDDVGLRFLEKGCPLLKAIDVSRCNCVSPSGLLSVISGHEGLEQMDARHCLSELSAPLINGLKNLNQLSVIRINGVRVSDFILQIIGTNCKSLVELGLSKCIGVTNLGIMQLVSGCGNLKTLDLSCCRFITDAAISTIANSCPDLACLKIESCDMVTEIGLYQLGLNCLMLEELDLTDCSGMNDIALKYLSRCSELVRLKLGLCTNISDIGLAHIACKCTKLAELDLYRCVRIGDDGLAALATGCNKLTMLNLSYCNRMTDTGLKCISNLGELSDLELRGISNITSIGIKAVAVNCKRLANLDLKHCEKINDSGFWALAFYAQNLQQVSGINFTQLLPLKQTSNDSINVMLAKGAQVLTQHSYDDVQINMSYCNVSDHVLCLLMSNLKRLQDAKLVHLTNVTVQGLELALRSCCGRIKKVKLQSSLRFSISSEILEKFNARGCKIRWD